MEDSSDKLTSCPEGEESHLSAKRHVMEIGDWFRSYGLYCSKKTNWLLDCVELGEGVELGVVGLGEWVGLNCVGLGEVLELD